MKAFQTFPSEVQVYQDRVSGATVRQLTGYLCHSFHTYFTNNGWWDKNRRLLFCSDRGNAANLFSIEIESGEISRLTNFQPGDRTPVYFVNDINSRRDEVCYIRDRKLYVLDLATLESQLLYEAPKGFLMSVGLWGADGRYVYVVLTEDLSDRVYADLNASYVGMQETFEAKPDCRIVRVDAEHGGSEVLWQENCWIGHANPSPTRANLLTFCHEGPWNLVDQRMWVLDTDTGKAEMLRPRRIPEEQIGHEYWYQDGVRVGYQVHKPGAGSYFGVIDYDGQNEQEAPCVPFPSPDHIHSNDFRLIVSDSGNCIKLYRYNGTDFDEARVLCMHDGSFFYQYHHPHPRFTADGKQVLFNSNVSGYCNLYLANVPEDVAALPKVEG